MLCTKHIIVFFSLGNSFTGVTSGAETAYPSGAPEFTPRFFVEFALIDL